MHVVHVDIISATIVSASISLSADVDFASFFSQQRLGPSPWFWSLMTRAHTTNRVLEISLAVLSCFTKSNPHLSGDFVAGESSVTFSSTGSTPLGSQSSR